VKIFQRRGQNIFPFLTPPLLGDPPGSCKRWGPGNFKVLFNGPFLPGVNRARFILCCLVAPIQDLGWRRGVNETTFLFPLVWSPGPPFFGVLGWAGL